MLIDFSENSPKQKTCCTISIGNSYVNLTYKRHLGISHRGTPIWTPKKTAEKGKGNGLETKKKSGAPCMIRTCGPRFRKPVLYPTELRGLKGVLKIITQTTYKSVSRRRLF